MKIDKSFILSAVLDNGFLTTDHQDSLNNRNCNGEEILRINCY